MELVKVDVGNKSYTCKIAKTEEDRKQGLQGIKSLPSDEGMLFIFDKVGDHEMWMKNTHIPLDQVFINDDSEVIFVYRAEPESETLVGMPNTKYVLEVNQGSGIKEGDDVDIDDSEDYSNYKMKVLSPDGSTQMYLKGGERICSRRETKILIKKAKLAYKNKGENFDRYCKALGKYMFKVLHGQDTRDPEYVEVPDAKKEKSDDKK